MTAIRDLGKRLQSMIAPVFGCLLIGYFVYHSVKGDHGAHAWLQLALRISAMDDEVSVLHARRAALERRVRLLRPDSLDPDMIEEQGRRLLNFSHRDDVYIVRPNGAIYHSVARKTR